MDIGFILTIAVILLLIGFLPVWRYSASWDYRPSFSFGLLALLTLVLALTGRL